MESAISEKIYPPLPRWRESPARRVAESRSPWHLLPVALAIGIAMNVLLPSWAGIVSSSVKLGDIAGLSALICALACAVILHELGHLTAALLMDFEILGGSLGPFRATRVHDRWTFQLSGRNIFTGSVSAIPKSNEFWRTRMLVVVAGGPAATLLTGASAALLLCVNQNGGWWTDFLGAITQFSFFLFVLGLIPNRPDATVRNDARLFASLRSNTPEAQEILLYHLLTQLSLAGIRPRDYPEHLIQELAAMHARADLSSVYAYTIVLWAMDRGDHASAAAWDRRMMELSDFCEARVRNLMLARSACFDVLINNNLSAAKNKFEEVDCELLSPPYFKHRAKAARALASSDIAEALAEVCRARYAFPKSLPYYDFEKMLLRRIHSKALAAEGKELVPLHASQAA